MYGTMEIFTHMIWVAGAGEMWPANETYTREVVFHCSCLSAKTLKFTTIKSWSSSSCHKRVKCASTSTRVKGERDVRN